MSTVEQTIGPQPGKVVKKVVYHELTFILWASAVLNPFVHSYATHSNLASGQKSIKHDSCNIYPGDGKSVRMETRKEVPSDTTTTSPFHITEIRFGLSGQPVHKLSPMINVSVWLFSFSSSLAPVWYFFYLMSLSVHIWHTFVNVTFMRKNIVKASHLKVIGLYDLTEQRFWHTFYLTTVWNDLCKIPLTCN